VISSKERCEQLTTVQIPSTLMALCGKLNRGVNLGPVWRARRQRTEKKRLSVNAREHRNLLEEKKKLRDTFELGRGVAGEKKPPRMAKARHRRLERGEGGPYCPTQSTIQKLGGIGSQVSKAMSSGPQAALRTTPPREETVRWPAGEAPIKNYAETSPRRKETKTGPGRLMDAFVGAAPPPSARCLCPFGDLEKFDKNRQETMPYARRHQPREEVRYISPEQKKTRNCSIEASSGRA